MILKYLEVNTDHELNNHKYLITANFEHETAWLMGPLNKLKFWKIVKNW